MSSPLKRPPYQRNPRPTLSERCKSSIPLTELDPTACCGSPQCQFCTEIIKRKLHPTNPRKKLKTATPEPSVDYWNVLPFPVEILHTILNMAARITSQERLKMGWETIHHALQPCSVCGKLLAVKTDKYGEITSSGKKKVFSSFTVRVPNSHNFLSLQLVTVWNVLYPIGLEAA